MRIIKWESFLGKNILVTGVLTDTSIAFHVARLAQEEGADIVLTSFGRAMSITTRIAGRFPKPAPVIELDVTNDEHLSTLADRVKEHLPHLRWRSSFNRFRARGSPWWKIPKYRMA